MEIPIPSPLNSRPSGRKPRQSVRMCEEVRLAGVPGDRSSFLRWLESCKKIPLTREMGLPSHAAAAQVLTPPTLDAESKGLNEARRKKQWPIEAQPPGKLCQLKREDGV